MNESYQLRITRQIPNPKYRPEADHHWNQDAETREPLLTVTAMEITVTEAQFQAIRKAVLEAF